MAFCNIFQSTFCIKLFIFCNDPRAAGTPDRVVTDLILVMEKSEECRSEWVQEIPRVPQSREHKCLQL